MHLPVSWPRYAATGTMVPVWLRFAVGVCNAFMVAWRRGVENIQSWVVFPCGSSELWAYAHPSHRAHPIALHHRCLGCFWYPVRSVLVITGNRIGDGWPPYTKVGFSSNRLLDYTSILYYNTIRISISISLRENAKHSCIALHCIVLHPETQQYSISIADILLHNHQNHGRYRQEHACGW